MVKDTLIGQTFRSTVADANPLWEVIRRSGSEAYLCEVVNEKYEINGKWYDDENAGRQDVFLRDDIRRMIDWQSHWEKRGQERATATAATYASLKAGDIVHYHDAFGRFVRCEVQPDKQLKPLGFVGNWQDYDIKARRSPNGYTSNPYWLDKVEKSELFQPGASNLWEAMDQKERDYTMRGCLPPTPQQICNFPRYEKPFDPTKEPMINTNLPPMTKDEKRIAHTHQVIGTAMLFLSEVYNKSEATEADLGEAIAKTLRQFGAK